MQLSERERKALNLPFVKIGGKYLAPSQRGTITAWIEVPMHIVQSDIDVKHAWYQQILSQQKTEAERRDLNHGL